MIDKTLERQKSTWYCIAILMMTVVSILTLVSKSAAAPQSTNSTKGIKSTSLGEFSPTFVGPAATGCSLLLGPFVSPTTASESSGDQDNISFAVVKPLAQSAVLPRAPKALPSPVPPRLLGPEPAPPAVSCEPLGPGCDVIRSSSGGAIGVKGFFTLTSQGYVSPRHEDLEFPAMAAAGFAEQDGGDGKAIMAFSLSGDGGPTGADDGGFYPSSAYGRLTSTFERSLGI